ncbi:Pseudouridine synthase, RsuA/RluB/C/D/E/F [Sesbania bispinosa]|nr:Pseudouridine synthase, RsuA/RluB/C/D/E/F [Sesbania bispinosa]
MDRKVKSFCFGALLLLFLCINLHLHGIAVAARPLEVKVNSILWTMKHSGPSPGGKGHKSSSDARILLQLNDSGGGSEVMLQFLLRVGALRSRHFSTRTGQRDNWLTLPPVSATVKASGTATGNQLSSSTSTTALKWVLRCCPHVPKTLVHKLFRLRQVRLVPAAAATQDHAFKRVAAKDTLNSGDRIFLPRSVKEMPPQNLHCHVTATEISFMRSLLIYKDPATLVLNKPPGMPVQGGISINRSLDVVAAACLKYEYSEPPRLVHRLDRDCSGILVMGRTKTSGAVLHSIFREKTSRASDDVVVDNGKSDRITIVDNSTSLSSQHAITEYRVIGSSSHGYTWLELSPLTGRKHQLRVHCAEVLGTPIVGDYKYGWQAHRKWDHFALSNMEDSREEVLEEETLPFGLNLNKGSISEKHPRLHLHCKQIVLPNISQALQNVQSDSNYDLSQVETLDFVADMPAYMQRSWDVTNS